MLKIPAECNRNASSAKLKDIFAKILPASLLDVSAGIFQWALVDESGMVKTQIGDAQKNQ
jgi:hypothetical protein